jgi:peptidylprolyl isomerase
MLRFALLALALVSSATGGSAQTTPADIVAQAPPGDWTAIPADSLLVMDLAPDRAGKPRRIVIQLMPPPFAAGHIANIRTLARAHWWDGTSINRVQDNYVVQWGDASEKKPLPEGLIKVPESAYLTPVEAITAAEAVTHHSDAPEDAMLSLLQRAQAGNAAGAAAMAGTQSESAPNGWHDRDSYAEWVEIHRGWPLAEQGGNFWPVHCYGMVGVGRNLSPDTGTGAELYTVIGQAPRQLDRNIALVGRVISGIEHLSALPRGTGPLGFYETAAERVGIRSVRLASELPEGARPRFEYLSTDSLSFAHYVAARASRKDSFYFQPAHGIDICNIVPPIRPAKG